MAWRMQNSFCYFICASLAHISAPLSGVAMAVFFAGFLLNPQIGISEEDRAYFDNSKQAVDSIRTMLSSKSWNKLSSYYDLSGAGIDRASLISGYFFIRKKKPEVSHPAGFWKFKQPFPPQFTYLSHRNLSDGIVEVTVHIEIDQGGGLIQRGMDDFQLRKSSNGYQLLPKPPHPPTSPSTPEKPVSIPLTVKTMPDLNK